MVAHNEAVSMVATTSATSCTRTSHNRKAESLRWRSTGWTPLAYPASALFDSNASGNTLFPLQRDVLRAAIRELLILDGSMDYKTLKVKDEGLRKSRDKQGNALKHVEPSLHEMDEKKESCGKRKFLSSSSSGVNVRTIKKMKNDDVIEVVEENEATISCAEKLVDYIIERAFLSIDHPSFMEPSSTSEDGVTQILEFVDSHERLPRKVSDVDQASIAPVLLDMEQHNGGDEVSLFLDLANRNADGGLRFFQRNLPPFLDVSIASEKSLRHIAYRIVARTCSSFEDEPIRLFLGYKSGALKRQPVLRVLSDYLFDVSHAMFAWKQTESEILSERGAVPASFDQETDSLVRDSLFDDRALKKIGGFDDSSILRHAIQISRSDLKKESWERFAKTKGGRRLFSHHRVGRAHLVGQKRRGQRIKRFSSSASTETLIFKPGQRSRASSIVSCCETGTDRSFPAATEIPKTHQDRASTNAQEISVQNCSELLELTLYREIGQSWGVLLSREGDMCVVERSSESSSLRCGDMILSIKNDRYESASPPTSIQSSTGISNPDWFKEIVDLFKGSYELHLVVRRVRASERTPAV